MWTQFSYPRSSTEVSARHSTVKIAHYICNVLQSITNMEQTDFHSTMRVQISQHNVGMYASPSWMAGHIRPSLYNGSWNVG